MVDQIVLALIVLASTAYFLLAIWKRLSLMRKSREKNLNLDGVGKRLWRVIAEVLLQVRVIRERPLVGLMHALVVWGFTAFAWVSLEHIGHGIHGFALAQASRSWYSDFAACWAVAVLLGIFGLSFRRFVLRPKTLGKYISATSALVALLICVLMVTYLLEWWLLEAPSAEWRVNWWIHTCSLFGMLWLIPNSKHLHLVLSPFAIFFRSHVMSTIRALREEDDEDFGMLKFVDLSQKDILDVNSCVECGRCTDRCPANLIGGSLDPKKIVLQLQHGLLSNGDRITGSAAMVQRGEAWVSEEDLYQCLTCGACEEVCPVGIEHVGMKILDMRRGLVSEGSTNSEKLTTMFTTMERTPHNAWGASQQVRTKLLADLELPIFGDSSEWLFWLGCGCSYDLNGQKVVKTMKPILEAAGISWGVLSTETCCGEPARRAGNEYLYLELSQQVIDMLRSKRVKKIVTCDPHCACMFDLDYRQQEAFQDLGVEVVHHTELLAQLMEKLPLEPSYERITLHDPCYLARGRGVTEQPRKILDLLGAELVEMTNHAKQTFCCGAGGAQLYIADDTVEMPVGRVNHQRFEQIEKTGAQTVAVACPYCPIMLRDAATQANREDIRIADLAELVAERLLSSNADSAPGLSD